jgi:hypothetical protein
MEPWAKELAPDRKPRAMSASHGEESGGADHPLPQGLDGERLTRGFLGGKAGWWLLIR